MINEETLITQIQNEKNHSVGIGYLLQYRDYWLTKGFEKGWDRCMGDRKKTHAILKENIVKEKNRLLDELHDEIYKIGNDKDNIQG